MNKKILTTAVFALGLTVAVPAHATIYTYRQSNDNVLTINTATGTGTLVGTSVNLSFTSAAFRTFTGGAAPSGTFTIDSIQGTRTVNGVTSNAVDVNTDRLTFQTNGSTSIWFQTVDPNGRRIGNDVTSRTVQFVPPPPTGSTGGSTGGGSTGGGPTDVPAPGMLALFGLGAAAVAIGRRRRKKIAA